MRPIHKRILIALAIDCAFVALLALAGAGWWALAAIPFSAWCQFDGRTRRWIGRHP